MTLAGFIVIGQGLTLQRMTATGDCHRPDERGEQRGSLTPKCAQRPRRPIRLVAVLPSLNVLGAHAHHDPPIGEPAPLGGSGFSPPPPISRRGVKLPGVFAGSRDASTRGAGLICRRRASATQQA